MSHLPIAVATRKRIIQLHPMVKSSILSDCTDNSDRMILRDVDIPIFTTIDSHDLHIHEQGTS